MTKLFSACILLWIFFLKLPILCQNNNNLNKKILKFPINRDTWKFLYKCDIFSIQVIKNDMAYYSYQQIID